MKSEIRKRKGLKHYGGESENIIINCWKCPEEGQAAGGRRQGAGARGQGAGRCRGQGCSPNFYTGKISREVLSLTFCILSLTKKCLFCIPSFEIWYPFHKPSFHLCTPLTAVNMNKSQNQNLFLDFFYSDKMLLTIKCH